MTEHFKDIVDVKFTANLENKLDRAVTEKVDKFKAELGNKTLDVIIVEELAKGNIELLPKEEIIAFLKQVVKSKSYYYSISVAIQDLINEDDKNRLDSEVKGRDTKLQDYRDSLSKAKQKKFIIYLIKHILHKREWTMHMLYLL